MISKIVEAQLKSCVFANLNNYNPETNTYLIPRYTKPQYIVGKCYLIKLPGHIIKNPNSILATNWNKGSAPQHEYYKACINKLVGKMLYVDCLAYDFENKRDISIMWSGYLDSEEITQVEAL